LWLCMWVRRAVLGGVLVAAVVQWLLRSGWSAIAALQAVWLGEGPWAAPCKVVVVTSGHTVVGARLEDVAVAVAGFNSCWPAC